MRLSYKRLLFTLGLTIFATITILCSSLQFTAMGFGFAFLASIILFILAKVSVNTYTNLIIIFVGFFILYGLSGPMDAIWGATRHHLFSEPTGIDSFLIQYALAAIGLGFGVMSRPIMQSRVYNVNTHVTRFKPHYLFKLAIAFALLSSLMELVNFTRSGGIAVLSQGKAVYQSAASSLVLTLPSVQVALLAFALVGLALGCRYYKSGLRKVGVSRYLIPFFLSLLPLVLIVGILGRRGIFLAWFLILVVGITYFYPIRRLGWALVLTVFIVYLGMGFIYANRSLITSTIGTGDWGSFHEKALSVERLAPALNPGKNEFGAAFWNFNEYTSQDSHSLMLGETYFKGLLVPIPSFIYPGQKPQQITYEFRDRFFPSEAKRGAIAGTGFSSILEAFMNFGSLGVILVYSFVGRLLVNLESLRLKVRSIYYPIFYLMLLPLCQTFHRSSFGSIFGEVFFAIVLLTLFWLTRVAAKTLSRINGSSRSRSIGGSIIGT